MAAIPRCYVLAVVVSLLVSFISTVQSGDASSDKKRLKPKDDGKWKKKDIRDYSEVDLEKLYDQWEENDDEELPEDELPPYERTPPPIDMSKLDTSNPESLLRATKKGRALMMFASVVGEPSEAETERATALWQTSLYNAHVEIKRYVVGPGRILISLDDGARAFEVKDFLIKQDNCLDVTIDGQVFDGKGKKLASKVHEKSTKDKARGKTEL